MKSEDILKFLQSVGLTEYEAKVYSTLSANGQMKAGEVSKDSGVPQSKVYWVLDDLIEKQMVEVAEGKPKEFRAVKSDVAVRRLIEDKEKKINSMKLDLREFSTHMKPMKKNETSTGIWTSKGRNWIEFFNKSSEMVAKSRKYVHGVTRDYSRSARLAEVIDSASKRGVKMKVIGMQKIDESNWFKAKWYLDHGVEMRIIDTNIHPRIVVMDGKEVLLRLDHEHKKKEGFPFSSVWSEDPSLVKVFDTYVKNVWENAAPVDTSEINRIMQNSEV